MRITRIAAAAGGIAVAAALVLSGCSSDNGGNNNANANIPGGGNPSASTSAGPDGGVDPAAQSTCDPDSGDCGQGGGGSDSNVAAQPVSATADLGDGLRIALMVLAGALLLGLGFGPPLVAQVGARRRQRSGDPTMPGDRS